MDSSKLRYSSGTMKRPPISSITPQSRRKQRKTFMSEGVKNLNSSFAGCQNLSKLQDEQAEHWLEECGSAMPIVVTETLTDIQRSSKCSVTIDPSGWLWLASGRKLVVWNYGFSSYSKIGPCYELALPHTDLTNKAQLVAVFAAKAGYLMPSCLSVTPEGTVRYWPYISQGSSSIEIHIDLKDDIGMLLTPLETDTGCVLGTATSSFYLITVDVEREVIQYKAMRSSQGLLSGLGRRMSSLFYGPAMTAASQSGSALCQLLAGEMSNDNSQFVYALTGSQLQKWMIDRQNDKLMYQCPAEDMFRENLAQAVWKLEISNLSNLHTKLLDMQLIKDGIMVLGAGVNLHVSTETYYAVGTLHTEGVDAPLSMLSFHVLQHNNAYDEMEQSFVEYRLILPDQLYSVMYLYNNNCIICATVTSQSVRQEAIDYKNIGGGSYNGQAVFLSDQGVLTCVQSAASTINQSIVHNLSRQVNFSMLDTSIIQNTNAEKIAQLSLSKEKLQRLQAAFLASITDLSGLNSQSMVDELFPPGLPQSNEPDAVLDTVVVELSKELIDDYPASDPRWAESIPRDVGSTSASLILVHQLNDKLKVHDFYINFLKKVSLWDRLFAVTTLNGVISTHMLLCEHAEKIEATKALHTCHMDHQELINEAIGQVLARRNVTPSSGRLTPQDLFYREVSGVQDIMEVLYILEEEAVNGDIASDKVFYLVSTINSLLRSVIQSAISYRHSREDIYSVVKYSQPVSVLSLPWTVSERPNGMRTFLLKQHELTVTRALSECQTSQQKEELLQQLFDITDIILDGYGSQLDCLRMMDPSTSQALDTLHNAYNKHRYHLIAAIVEHGDYVRAAALAEKYFEFFVLVEICEKTNDQQRIREYMNRFKHKNCAEAVFKWYIDHGKESKLMASELASHPDLAEYLQITDNKSLGWIHQIASNRFYQSHLTLLDLARSETDLASRKKTFLSLSKLAALATQDKPANLSKNIEDINNELNFLLHQEQLPDEVIESLGTDRDKMAVLSTEQLIQLYISNENSHATEFEFKKALDLLLNAQDITGDEWNKLLVDIWCEVIKRDRWNEISTTDPVTSCRPTILYKTLELAVAEGMDLSLALPSADTILSSNNIKDFREDQQVQFLIRSVCEQALRMATD